LFARRYPECVAGLVFADAATSDLLDVGRSIAASPEVKVGCPMLAAAGRLGIVRLIDPFGLRKSAQPADARSAAVLYRSQPWVALCALVNGMPATSQEFADAPPLRSDLPLTVLAAERSEGLVPSGLEGRLASRAEMERFLETFHGAQQRLARRSSRGSWTIVAGSGHLIAASRPSAVVGAVREMLVRLYDGRSTLHVVR